MIGITAQFSWFWQKPDERSAGRGVSCMPPPGGRAPLMFTPAPHPQGKFATTNPFPGGEGGEGVAKDAQVFAPALYLILV